MNGEVERSFEHGNRPDRASTASSEFQRKPDEFESTLSNHLVQVVHAFYVGDTSVAANIVGFEIELPFRRWRDCLDSENLATFVCKPVNGFRRKAGKIVLAQISLLKTVHETKRAGEGMDFSKVLVRHIPAIVGHRSVFAC